MEHVVQDAADKLSKLEVVLTSSLGQHRMVRTTTASRFVLMAPDNKWVWPEMAFGLRMGSILPT